MKNLRSYRELASLCRQLAAFHPEESPKWLADAGRWEHFAETEVVSHFHDCNTFSNHPLDGRELSVRDSPGGA